MGDLSDLCLPPEKEEKSLDQLVDTCSRGSCEDRISYLSDDILLVILSFLTLSEAVKTSLLSRRWLNVWMHTPVLNLIGPTSSADVNETECLNYVELVSHALERHKSQCLKEFKLVCYLDGRMQKVIDNWLVFALSRKVQHLELNLLFEGLCPVDVYGIRHVRPYVFPNRFLESDLKCLRSLSLKSVRVTGEAINFFLMNCPFLERIEVAGTRKFFSLVISGPNLALKYLQIKDCCDFRVLSISNANVVSLEIPPIQDLTLTGLPKLVELSITKKMPYSRSNSSFKVGSFHSQLEALTLRGLNLKEAIGLSNLDQMTKLKRLVIEVRFINENLIMLIPVINSCPCLKEFVLMLELDWCDRTTRTMCEVESGGSSLQSKSLKVFEFLGYCGRVSDVELIVRVVENFVCLEKIILDLRHPGCLENPRYYFEPKEKQEIRSLALNQLEALRKSKSIPPHVDVLIR